MKKKILAILVALLIPFSCGLFGLAGAVTEAGITCIVQPGYVSITVAPTTIDFGVINPLGSNQTVGDYINATNNGTTTADMDIKATNSTNWTLVYPAAGTDEFNLKHNETAGAWTGVNLTYSPIATGVLADSSIYFDLNITVGNTAITAEQTFTTTIRVVIA